jgi:hypothetical protein
MIWTRSTQVWFSVSTDFVGHFLISNNFKICLKNSRKFKIKTIVSERVFELIDFIFENNLKVGGGFSSYYQIYNKT